MLDRSRQKHKTFRPKHPKGSCTRKLILSLEKVEDYVMHTTV